jgi:hypothetical protein
VLIFWDFFCKPFKINGLQYLISFEIVIFSVLTPIWHQFLFLWCQAFNTILSSLASHFQSLSALQYIMGHAHIDVTMEVYNHIGELTRIENEIARLDSMVLNAWHHKKKNWCQIGVKTEKITISKEIRYCKPLILKGLQKKSQKISTHHLTVLTKRCNVILQIEQEQKGDCLYEYK